jgi:uncharacterized membrane protein (UPF0182 family)
VPRLRLSPLLVILALAALLFAFPTFTALLTDWWWFREIGYEVIFTRELITRSLLFLIVGAVTAVALYLNGGAWPTPSSSTSGRRCRNWT